MTVTDFEGLWVKTVGLLEAPPSNLELDLQNVEYIDQECLLYLVGLVSARTGAKQTTSIALPLKDTTIDFLRAWGLPEALEEAAGLTSFVDLLTLDSRKRYEKRISQVPIPLYVKVIDTPGGGRERLLSLTYFALTPIDTKRPAEEAASIVKNQWLDVHLVSVLDRYLANRGSRVASNILHEAVLNAASHPNARYSSLSAQMVVGGGRKELVLCIWDDGESFADTLSDALLRFGTIRSPASEMSTDTFVGTFQDFDREGKKEPIRLSSQNLEVSSRPEFLILSAFFLGFTSAPLSRLRSAEHQAVLDTVPETLLPAPARGFGGLGLHLVRKNVIDLFGGSILYATGPYRVRLSKSRGSDEYTTTILRLSASGPSVRGNLLVARIPLADG